MILQTLYQHYHRLLQRGEPGLAVYGYSQEKISQCIVLAPDGAVTGVVPLLNTSGKKPVPRSLLVPQPTKSTSAIVPKFLWDKTAYVLGVSAASKRADREHAAFKQFHLDLLRDERDEGLRALAGFLERWTPEQFVAPHFAPDMRDGNIVFRLDGDRRFLHERPAAMALRSRILAPRDDASPSMLPCLVTGEHRPAARLHPAIKGVFDAQSSGASIVSFNQDSFNSYGKSQGENAPVSEEAAFAYTTLLNHLLRRDAGNRQRLTVGDATVVFWAEADEAPVAEAAENFLAQILISESSDTDQQATEKVRASIEKLSRGLTLTGADDGLRPGTRMVLLGLAPNASRLSVRFWLRDSLGALAQRLQLHARDLALEPQPWKTLPTPWRLALCTAPMRGGKAKSEDISPMLAGDMLRAILTGQRYPRSLLANLLMRMRADGQISGVRVALCKAVICRERRLAAATDNLKEIPVSLDTDLDDPAYLLGRLFSMLEAAQRAALGGQVNATIRDRYFGAASATPALVYGLLMRNAQNHLARVRKDKPGLAVILEKDIGQVVRKLPPHLPRSLNLTGQGTFAVGYYHQSEERFRKPDSAGQHVDFDSANALAST